MNVLSVLDQYRRNLGKRRSVRELWQVKSGLAFGRSVTLELGKD